MSFDDFSLPFRRPYVRVGSLLLIVIGSVVWASMQLQSGPPRSIVLASGTESGVYHQHARRYAEILGSQGITVEERMTSGASDNLRLLLDPTSGVHVALLQAGIAPQPQPKASVMIASLYYEPL